MEALERVLKERAHGRPWYRGGTLIGTVVLHVGLAAAAIIAPTLFAERPKTLEYVSVQIVPAAALGQIAVPPPPPPAPPAPVKPVPEEAPPPPAPEPEPEPEKPAPAPSKPREPDKKAPPAEPAPPSSAVEQPAPVDPTRLDATNTDPLASPGRLGSPKGNPLATSGPAEISGFDDPDFTYSYYADLMLAQIRKGWERPPLGGEIEMVVHFQVHKDGRVSDVEILESSGYNSFDRAGMRAVQTATMPPLPKSYRRGILGVHLIIR